MATRRAVLTAMAGMMGGGALAQPVGKNMNQLAYVGCRTTRERNARGDGLTVWRIRDGAWTRIQLLDGLYNPSFLAFDRSRRFLYTVHGDASEVSAFRILADGTLAFLNKLSCNGKNPVHLTVDPSNRWLVVANHLTVGGYVSNVAVLPRRADGGLEPVSDVVELKDKPGPNTVDQPFAKPHQVAYDPQDRFIAVPDKGCDMVRSFALVEGKLKPAAAPAIARPGAGPRHIAFTGGFAYVINELDSTVTAFRHDAATGALAEFQRLSSVPDDFTGFSTGAEIAVAPNGRFVYASNRGHDSIAAFAIGAEGRLALLGTWPSGKTPRFFALTPDGGRLYAANEDGDTIVGFAVHPDGMLTPLGTVAQTGSPTCILFG